MTAPAEITGADIIGALLRADTALTAVVQAGNIKAARLADNAALPALLVRTIGSTERDTLSRGVTVRLTDLVAVTVRATSYNQQVEVLGMARRCCAGRTGDIGGGLRVAITGASKSPDMSGPGDTYEQRIDFRVSFDTAA